jgi:hypothetical protein
MPCPLPPARRGNSGAADVLAAGGVVPASRGVLAAGGRSWLAWRGWGWLARRGCARSAGPGYRIFFLIMVISWNFDTMFDIMF